MQSITSTSQHHAATPQQLQQQCCQPQRKSYSLKCNIHMHKATVLPTVRIYKVYNWMKAATTN